jgi:succinyl-diaminopimelate desuccinylase
MSGGTAGPGAGSWAGHVDVDRLVELTGTLVEVATANPPGDEGAAGGVLRQALEPWAPEWQEVEPAPGRLSLVARVATPAAPARPAARPGGPGTGTPTLVVNGHTDVVPVVPERWSRPPFSPSLAGGRLYGRGTADMKGGLAAAICALAALKAAGEHPACHLVFQFVADEERGGALGTRALLEAGLLAGDACLVPEPTSLAVCVAERGLLQGEITVRGRPGHGSRPREGVSAVEHAAQLALALHAADFGGPEHPLLGRPTANIGTLHGGSARNIVAEHAVLGFDRRILPGVGEQEAVAELRRRIEEAGLGHVDYEISVHDYGEGSEMSADHPFAGLVRRCVENATGAPPATIGMTFTTDARFLRNQGGIPTVVCGPGDVAQAHGIDEWVAVDQLVQATAAYAELYRSFGASGAGQGGES